MLHDSCAILTMWSLLRMADKQQILRVVIHYGTYDYKCDSLAVTFHHPNLQLGLHNLDFLLSWKHGRPLWPTAFKVWLGKVHLCLLKHIQCIRNFTAQSISLSLTAGESCVSGLRAAKALQHSARSVLIQIFVLALERVCMHVTSSNALYLVRLTAEGGAGGGRRMFWELHGNVCLRRAWLEKAGNPLMA